MPGENGFIGNKEIEMANDDITIIDQIHKGTKELWELLTLKEQLNYEQ